MKLNDYVRFKQTKKHSLIKLINYVGFYFVILWGINDSIQITAQDIPFNTEAYIDFLSKNNDITPAELNKLYPSDLFMDSVSSFDDKEVLYLDLAIDKFELTQDELELLNKNGFVVSERLHLGSYYKQFETIYKNDLPVFISTDAILHAVHMSYDQILMQTELNHLIPELIGLLQQAQNSIQILHNKYYSIELMRPMLQDIDLYLAIPVYLLEGGLHTFYPENKAPAQEIISYIINQKPVEHALFSDNVKRKVDYSQFKPRGHYTEELILEKYFKAMMWLGRMEFYLDNKDLISEKEFRNLLKRQTIDAALLHEVFTYGKIYDKYKEIEDLLSFFVGSQDNVTIDELGAILKTAGIENKNDLLLDENFSSFIIALRSNPGAKQNILSQLLKVNNYDTTSSIPSSFLLFGQRFVIDSYVTNEVVWDRIIHEGEKMCRLVPSTLDIMFTLGNNSSTQLLLPELQKWKYSDNLAGLRFLIDQYPEEFWESSLYNMWLYSIQSLSPDPKMEGIPDFMKTSAWGLEKMNSQLCSWTELRHDNLLYAKPSYTSWGSCSHPEGYVEPNEIFFQRLKKMAENANRKFSLYSFESVEVFTSYFQYLYAICDTLEGIARKELNNIELTEEECIFFDNVTHSGFTGSAAKPDGWYYNLIFNEQEVCEEDFVVADYHTTPTTCGGTILGWVSHAGTGPTNLIIAVAPLSNGELCSFYGPVGSYYEYKTADFYRLNDDEWIESYQKTSMRPEWVKNYIADNYGMKQKSALNLFTSQDEYYEAYNSYWTSTSNPANYKYFPKLRLSISPSTAREFTRLTIHIPQSQAYLRTQIKIFDSGGRLITDIMDNTLPPGNYTIEWNLLDNNGNKVPEGVYYLNLIQKNQKVAEKLIVM